MGDPKDRPVPKDGPAPSVRALFERVQTRPVAIGVRPTWPTGQGRKVRAYPFEDPATKAKILESFAKGYPAKTCVQAAGIPWTTWIRWELRADHGEEPFAAFFTELRGVWHEGQLEVLDMVRGYAQGAVDHNGDHKGSWQAGKWILEKADPQTYAAQPVQRISADLTVSPGEVKQDLTKLTTEELEDLYRLTVKLGDGVGDGTEVQVLSDSTGSGIDEK